MRVFDPSGLSRTEIDQVAADIRQSFQKRFHFQNAKDIHRIATTNLGGSIIYESTMGEGPWGSIEVHGPRDFTIYLPSYTTTRQDRFTIAHELGHYFLHSRQGEIPGIGTRHLQQHARLEWEANWFAASLLMPQEEFYQSQAELRDIRAVADKFGVSVEPARVRANALDALKEKTDEEG